MQEIEQIQNELNKTLNQDEINYIRKWVNDYNYNYEMISFTLHHTTNQKIINFEYIDKLLSDWNNRNLKTKEDVIKWIDDIKNKKI